MLNQQELGIRSQFEANILQFESLNSHYFEEDLKTRNFTRRKVEHFLQLCNNCSFIGFQDFYKCFHCYTISRNKFGHFLQILEHILN